MLGLRARGLGPSVGRVYLTRGMGELLVLWTSGTGRGLAPDGGATERCGVGVQSAVCLLGLRQCSQVDNATFFAVDAWQGTTLCWCAVLVLGGSSGLILLALLGCLLGHIW